MSLAEHPDVLTVAQVAGVLQVSDWTVRRLVAEHELPALRLGRSIRIPRTALERFIGLNPESDAAPSAQPGAASRGQIPPYRHTMKGNGYSIAHNGDAGPPLAFDGEFPHTGRSAAPARRIADKNDDPAQVSQ